MTRFCFLENNSIVISRMTELSGGKNYFSTVTANIGVTLQKLSLEKTEIAGGVFGKTYIIYCDTAIDVEEGDKIKDDDGNFYKVKKGGITKEEMGGLEFYKILIEQTG